MSDTEDPKDVKARHAAAQDAMNSLKNDKLVRRLLKMTGEKRLVELRGIQNEILALIEEMKAANPEHSETSDKVGMQIAELLRGHGSEVSTFITMWYGASALQVLIALYEETT